MTTTMRWAAAALGVVMLAACKDGTGLQARTPAQISIINGDGREGKVGTILSVPVIARVADAQGRVAPGEVVSFTVLTGGGSVGAGSVTTDADGLARTTWTLGGAAGEQKLEARLVPASGTGTPLADTARVSALPGSPASIAVVGSATRTDTTGRTVADSLAVVVRDGFGNPVPGITVTFTPSAGGGTVSPTSAATRTDGTARTAWTLGSTAGTQTVTASIAAGATPVSFTATALPNNQLQLVAQVTGSILDVARRAPRPQATSTAARSWAGRRT
ncbi:MAG: Ig-like domain-containing protein [Longimicrobiaceae bacterium]